MTLAVYDYLGYYNICHLGDEVRDPARTIPRAVNRSIWIVAILYLTMNISILGVIPWQEAMKSDRIAADVMERVYGRPVAVAFTWLIVWAVVACMFSITLGYSRIPVCGGPAGGLFFRLLPLASPRGQYPDRFAADFGRIDGDLLLFPAAASDRCGGCRADPDPIHRSNDRAAPLADNAARLSAPVSHAALPVAEPRGPRRLAVSLGHDRLEGLTVALGRHGLAASLCSFFGEDEGREARDERRQKLRRRLKTKSVAFRRPSPLAPRVSPLALAPRPSPLAPTMLKSSPTVVREFSRKGSERCRDQEWN